MRKEFSRPRTMLVGAQLALAAAALMAGGTVTKGTRVVTRREFYAITKMPEPEDAPPFDEVFTKRSRRRTRRLRGRGQA